MFWILRQCSITPTPSKTSSCRKHEKREFCCCAVAGSLQELELWRSWRHIRCSGTLGNVRPNPSHRKHVTKPLENMSQSTKHLISVKFDTFFGLKRQAWQLFSALNAKLGTYLRRYPPSLAFIFRVVPCSHLSIMVTILFRCVHLVEASFAEVSPQTSKSFRCACRQLKWTHPLARMMVRCASPGGIANRCNVPFASNG